MTIRKITEAEMGAALDLVWRVFLEYEAPDYPEEGVAEFRRSIDDPVWVGAREFYGAFDDRDGLIGVIATKDQSHIALFFVDSARQRQGVGRALFADAKARNPYGFFTVNASPYAHGFYLRLGFRDAAPEQCVNGLRFYPMKKEAETGLQIRDAQPEDLDAIAALYVENHRETYAGLLSEEYFSRLTPAHAREKWAAYRDAPGHRLWAAYEGGVFLGFSAGMPDPVLPDCWYLDSLHVAEAARGRGVGSALLRRHAAHAAGQGFANMSVCIVRGNERARRLYEKLGAEHFSYFEDDFCGTVSHSEKLVWRDLSALKGEG
ncbi:MAG: GNAT family N-acetyltransferase [Oscillospiraceae bacterium]|nr:GNAT family N-acetyltransferase [Oscillospiraceae bacterium]